MKQSTFSAVMANNLLTVLQGYSKTIRLLLVMFLTLTVSAEVWAEEGNATITFSDAGLSDRQSVDGTSFALGDYFTVTYAKNGSSNNPTYYTSGTAIRCYVTKSTSNGNTITINQTENGKGVNAYITSVTYSGTNKKGTTSFAYSGTPTNSSNYSVAYSDASKVTSVVATLKETGGSENGQFYSTGITITYTYTAGGGGSTPTQLTAPTGLTVDAITSSGATLSWDAVANASSYVVTIVDGGSLEKDYPVTGITTTVSDLESSTDYLWTVTAVGDGINYTNSEESSEIGEFTTSAPAGGGGGDEECTWELVTDASTLKDGDEVVIAAKDYNFAISTTQNNNNRGQAAITKSENTIEEPSTSVQILTLKTGKVSSSFAFQDNDGTNDGYLCAASSSSNYLRTETTLSNNSSWAITIANDGAATLEAQGTYSRNVMQYNQSSSIFSCYNSASQKALVIYKKVCWTCETPVFDIKIKDDNPVVFSGESIELTVVGSNIAADATYQWYKKNGENYDELTGETTNKLTIAEATANDAGNYKCEVTNGTCSAENNFTVKMYSLRGLTDNNWSTDFVFAKDNATTATYSMELAGNSSYYFKVYDGSAYYGNTGGNPTMTSDNCTNWTMQENMGNNVTLQTTAAGTYTFTLDYTDASNPTISVTYPAKRIIYLKPDVWATDNPKFAVHAWHGSTAEDILMTKIDDCKNRDIYFTEIDAAHTHVIFIRGNKDSYDISNPWNNVWNQTGDLTIDNVQYNIGSEWNFSKASWTSFTPNYTVTFDENGHGTAPDAQCVAKNGKATTPAAPTETGYTFGGWYKEVGCTNVWDFANDVVTEDITLYAKWTINTHTVTWNPAGGNWDGNASNIVQTCKYDELIEAPEKPVRTDYEFVEWKPTYTADMTMPDKDLEFTAQWQINQYTVTLNPNYPNGKTGTFTYDAGELVDGNLVLTYDYNTASMTIEDLYTSLTLDGYDFGGWYNAKGVNPGEVSGSKCTTTGTITGNKTYFAKWSKLYSITLSENGTTTELDAQTSTSYTLPTELSAGTCQDDTKELVGWSTVAIPTPGDKPTTNFYELGETVTLTADQTTFYAVFATGTTTDEIITTEETAMLSFDDTSKRTVFNEDQQVWEQNGIVFTNNKAESSNDIANYINPVRCYKNSEIIIDCNALGNITKVLFRCSSSDFAGDLEISIGQEATSDGTWVTLIPKLKSKIYEITLTEGQTRISTLTVTYEKISDNASSVSYSDYTTSCDNTKATITYDLNGGTGADCEKQVVTKGEEFTLCSQTPTKEGYTFAGWSDGTTIYAAGAQVTVSESTTFYATWTAKTITITWDQNYTDCPESETSTYIYDGEDIDMPEDPTREGYKFDGWYTADGTEITEVGETNKPTSDVTYYAHWAELYTVTFMASGQVYVVQEHKYLSGETLELPADPSAANYACDGYIFEGWSAYEKTKEDATLPELVSTSTTIDADKEFYALWKKASSEGAGETIFYESFNDSEGTGGNDDKWSGDIATSEAYVDNNGWEGDNVSGADQCIKLGSGSKKGSITTPELSQLSGSATLSFKAAAWNGNNEQVDLILSIDGGGMLSEYSVKMTKGAWQTYEVTIIDGTQNTKITFAGKNTSYSRFFLDEVNITTSGSYNYTTLPNCGPTIVAKDGMWVTSADGQSVKVNVPIAVKSFTTTATITGTSANENFEVTRLENVGNGINNVLEVIYTPTTANSKESATITLTAKDGEIVVSTTTFTLNGRSLPDQFAIVVDKASEYYALPANMPAEDTYLGFGVEVNDGTVTAAPKTHLYTMRAVHSTRFAENGTAIRLVGNNNACLWASSAKDGTGIRNYAQVATATDTQYEWNLYTEDGDTYRISCTAVTEEGRILRMYGQKFGMYKSGSDGFRLLPVECTSTPLNVSASAARTSATISWTNAEACDVEVYNGSTKVQTISAATSPVVVSGLAESTAYTFTLTPTDNAACVASGAFTTTGPTIDIVEWETDGIVIQVDKDDELNPKVVIKGEEEHGDVGGNVATELFFSKYFEAHAENKLLAIFNGTTATIDLTGYTIKSENGTLDLSQFGQTKGKVASNEEIILVYYDAKYSAEECAEIQKGYENWNILTEKSVLAFSGRGSLGLYKNDVLIDVIGSTFPSGELTKIGKSGSPDNCGTDENVRLHIDGVSVNDQSSFFCFNGDNIKTDNVETDYALSTNRCLLIRKNTVTSGANAVATNKADEGATCGDLSSTFATLCSEWSGYRIGSGKSSTDEIKNATCDGLGYVGGFDYNNYYRTLETIGDSEDLEDYTRNADENTYFITIDNLAQYSCLNIQLQLTDANGNVLTEQTSQVPILVTGEKSTTDEIFSAIVKDSETSDPDYENSKIRCSTCDVVILKDATLTKADADTENDINQVRDIYVYPGGRLIVPTAATDFSVNNISMRRVQDDVATANVETPLLITSSSNAPIYVDVRINAENWHWFTLPYDCNIADVTWVDGSKPKYNADWFLMYYDGESRAASTNPHDNHWKVYSGTTIEAGKGYIVGITGDVSKPAVKFELRFPMAQEVLTDEQKPKKVALNAWGVKSDNTPNNLGWNLVGNPYLNYYQPETEGFSGLSLLEYTGINPVTGDRLYDDSGNIPFLVTPIDGGWYEYQQDLASDVQMMPFTAYFVQVGDPDRHENGQDLDASFTAENRAPKSLQARRNASEENSDPAIVAVSLTNAKGESDKTTLLIADRFTNEYEMNADFFKWFGDYYKYYTKPVLYSMGADHGKRAFNALSEQLAAQPVALGMFAAQAGDYTFSLTRKRCDLSRVEEVWLYDATTATYTNLMQQDYTFTTAKTEGEGRFYLSVKMKQKTPTAVENVNGNLSLVAHQQTLVLSGLPAEAQVWVYDATGKLLHSEHTTAYQRIYPVQQAGVYFVSVKGQGDAQTLSTIVK